jgi:uncharacterized protein YkwD
VLFAPDKPLPGAFAKAEEDLLTLLNDARRRDNVALFKRDGKLGQAAQVQSKLMAHQKQLTDSLDGKRFDKLAAEAGYKFRIVNEYLLKTNRKLIGKEVYEQIMNDDNGRRLFMDRTYEEIGIAFGGNDKGEVYITIMLASP